jgi:ATP/maltotriose-dependent transcriptional regulator MalT
VYTIQRAALAKLRRPEIAAVIAAVLHCSIAQSAPSLLARRDLTTVRVWLATLPESLARARPRLGLLVCWSLAFAAQFEVLEARLHEIVRVLDASRGVMFEEQQPLISEVAVLRSRIAFSRNEVPDPNALRQALLDARRRSAAAQFDLPCARARGTLARIRPPKPVRRMRRPIG